MVYDIIARLRQNRKATFLLLAVIILGLGILLFMSLRGPSDSHYTTNKTNLIANNNFGYLSGSKIYAYNGLAFYSVDLTANNSVTVLNKGNKLPHPKAVYWADDKGAILNFDTSFSYSIVEETIRSSGKRLTTITKNYTWYLDFASNSLKMVSEQPIKAGLVQYSATGKGFYFIPDFSVEQTGGRNAVLNSVTPLRFFNIETAQTTVISPNLNAGNISYLGFCKTNVTTVCVIGQDPKNLRVKQLLTVDSSGSKHLQLEYNGYMTATSDPARFITMKAAETSDTNTNIAYEDSVDTNLPLTLHNLTKGTNKDMGFRAKSSTLTTFFGNDGTFFMIDNALSNFQNNKQVLNYRTGSINAKDSVKSAIGTLKWQDNTSFTGALLNEASYNSNGALMTAVDGSQVLISSRPPNEAIARAALDTISTSVTSCLQKSSGNDNQYYSKEKQFKVYFPDNGSLKNNINAFSDCMITAGAANLHGYNFYFGTKDPSSGRITSD